MVRSNKLSVRDDCLPAWIPLFDIVERIAHEYFECVESSETECAESFRTEQSIFSPINSSEYQTHARTYVKYIYLRIYSRKINNVSERKVAVCGLPSHTGSTGSPRSDNYRG